MVRVNTESDDKLNHNFQGRDLFSRRVTNSMLLLVTPTADKPEPVISE